ncbi:translation initiation factor [Verrucomicrobiales bacterium BCK34]|nr:translation initiation factor [Verrucomicrobiales bacterium BCK34]
MSRKKNRQSKGKGERGVPTPFSALNELSGLPGGSLEPARPTSRRDRKNTTRGRLNITREFAHRGGKIVTVVSNFQGISLGEKQELARKIQKSHGVGGTVKDGRIEIRGDLREEIKVILEEAGFQPKFSGG